VNDSTATFTLPVGLLEDVCDATTVTFPLAFAVAGDVYVGAPVYPDDEPPVADWNCSRVLSNVTATW